VSTYNINPCRPDRLRCDDCGEAVGAVVGPLPEGALAGLTRRQAMTAWPELTQAIVVHDLLCHWRRLPEAGEAWFAHAGERE
jgi:hypothetical protein